MKLCPACAVAGLAVAAAFVPGGSAVDAKCPNTPVLFADAPEPVWVLNGKAAAESDTKGLHRDSIESIQIVCAPDIHRVFEVRAHKSGIVIFTTPGPHTELKASLDGIAVLQQAHLAQHGRFAGDPGELRWSDPTNRVDVELTVSDDGSRWSATGTHRYLFGSASAMTVSGVRPQ